MGVHIGHSSKSVITRHWRRSSPGPMASLTCSRWLMSHCLSPPSGRASQQANRYLRFYVQFPLVGLHRKSGFRLPPAPPAAAMFFWLIPWRCYRYPGGLSVPAPGQPVPGMARASTLELDTGAASVHKGRHPVLRGPGWLTMCSGPRPLAGHDNRAVSGPSMAFTSPWASSPTERTQSMGRQTVPGPAG